ncbi:hypothetical protein CRYUN_Cryun11dG0022600 [Craigia yunnanensis]
MANQFSPSTHARFSYCLVPFRDATPHPIILRFGEDIPQLPPGPVQTTLFVNPSPGSYLYYLELLDISVGNHRLGFHPDMFKTRPDGSVLAVFEAYYGSRKLQRTTNFQGLELCYKNPANYHDFAAITFHFNGADYSVDGEYGHFFDPVKGFFCVGIVRGTTATVLGAWHQQNKRIIHDGGIHGLQFADEQCINDVL